MAKSDDQKPTPPPHELILDDDPIFNCALQICCPPLKAQDALAKILVRDGVDATAAAKCAEVIFGNFDLAPAGSLLLLRERIAFYARGEDYKP